MKHHWVANGCKCHVVCMNCDAVAHNDEASRIAVGVCTGKRKPEPCPKAREMWCASHLSFIPPGSDICVSMGAK